MKTIQLFGKDLGSLIESWRSQPRLVYMCAVTVQKASTLVHPTCKIRNALETDVTAILACRAEAFAPYRASYIEEADLDTVLTTKTLKHRMKDMAVFVAAREIDHSIIGTVACNLVTLGEGHLRGMAVLTACQGGGVAQHLLERAEAELCARKCTRITLDTTEPLKVGHPLL